MSGRRNVQPDHCCIFFIRWEEWESQAGTVEYTSHAKVNTYFTYTLTTR